MSYCQRKAVAICHLFHSKRRLPSCTLLTRWSASVKSGHAMQVTKLIKEDWPIVVITVRILAKAALY